jgi:hypothetical protein
MNNIIILRVLCKKLKRINISNTTALILKVFDYKIYMKYELFASLVLYKNVIYFIKVSFSLIKSYNSKI